MNIKKKKILGGSGRVGEGVVRLGGSGWMGMEN